MYYVHVRGTTPEAPTTYKYIPRSTYYYLVRVRGINFRAAVRTTYASTNKHVRACVRACTRARAACGAFARAWEKGPRDAEIEQKDPSLLG